MKEAEIQTDRQAETGGFKSFITHIVSSRIFSVPVASYRNPMGSVSTPVSRAVTMYIHARLRLCFLHAGSRKLLFSPPSLHNCKT